MQYQYVKIKIQTNTPHFLPTFLSLTDILLIYDFE